MKANHNGKHPYDDIIHLVHPVSSNHAPMSVHDRAAQFSPFAALAGYDGAIKETARKTDQRIELDEAAKIRLDEKLRIVQEQIDRQQEIEFVFFKPDEIKSGGAYISISGMIKKIDAYERVVVMQDGTKIPIEEVVDMTGDIFQEVDDYIA